MRKHIENLIPEKNHLAWATALVLLFIGVFYAYQVIDAYRNARQILSLVDEVKAAIYQQEWKRVNNNLIGVQRNMLELQGDIERLYPLTLIPGLSSEVRAAKSMLAAFNISITSAVSVVEWVSEMPNLNKLASKPLDELTEQDKAHILKQISEASSLWERINNQTLLSLNFLEDAQNRTRIPLVNTHISNLSTKLYKAQNLFAQIQPWVAIAPQVLGHNKNATYLILLQNNTELRPTGGFIGTYGILTIRNGELKNFVTDNVYNLDEPAKSYNTKVPPEPLQKYIKQSQWFLRDVNWDPDFPTTAQRAIQFYKDERGPFRNFAGVIALTPEVIEDLMAVLGSVIVDDKEFTAENLIDTLAYHVELGFKEEGITIYNRKQIIDDVAQQLKEKLFTSLSVTQLQNLIPIILSSLDQRQLMFYFGDDLAQTTIENFNWAGRVLPHVGDYVHIVDANLGSLKSDPAINRTISYTVAPAEDETLLATLSATYQHTGNFNWKTTRYRTYTRMYVPLGSTFVSAEGNEEEIAISDEHGKTVFGTFISIEPGDTETLRFTYKLPEFIVNLADSGLYDLYIQKQAGTRSHVLNLDLTMPFKVGSLDKSNEILNRSGSQTRGIWDLSQDREVRLRSK
jgi:hypothetical protein